MKITDMKSRLLYIAVLSIFISCSSSVPGDVDAFGKSCINSIIAGRVDHAIRKFEPDIQNNDTRRTMDQIHQNLGIKELKGIKVQLYKREPAMSGSDYTGYIHYIVYEYIYKDISVLFTIRVKEKGDAYKISDFHGRLYTN